MIMSGWLGTSLNNLGDDKQVVGPTGHFVGVEPTEHLDLARPRDRFRVGWDPKAKLAEVIPTPGEELAISCW